MSLALSQESLVIWRAAVASGQPTSMTRITRNPEVEATGLDWEIVRNRVYTLVTGGYLFSGNPELVKGFNQSYWFGTGCKTPAGETTPEPWVKPPPATIEKAANRAPKGRTLNAVSLEVWRAVVAIGKPVTVAEVMAVPNALTALRDAHLKPSNVVGNLVMLGYLATTGRQTVGRARYWFGLNSKVPFGELKPIPWTGNTDARAARRDLPYSRTPPVDSATHVATMKRIESEKSRRWSRVGDWLFRGEERRHISDPMTDFGGL